MATPRKKRTETPTAEPSLSTAGIPSVHDERLISLIPTLQELAA